jgi:hypothetical protein
MKRFLLLLLIVISCSPAFSHAAKSVPKALQKDLVTIEGAHFLINRFLLCQLSLPPSLGGGTPFNSFSMHVRFKAPAKGLISRDIFVALSMRLFTEAKIRLASEIPGLSTEQTLRAMQCHEVSDKTDRTEYTYFVTMSTEGVESRIKDKQRGTEQITQEPWSSVLKNLPNTNKP